VSALRHGQWVRLGDLPHVYRVMAAHTDREWNRWTYIQRDDRKWRGWSPESALVPCEPEEDAAHELVWLCQGGQP
jgi:hypothetical protein